MAMRMVSDRSIYSIAGWAPTAVCGQILIQLWGHVDLRQLPNTLLLTMQNWEWPLVWEGIAASLGITLEAIPRPEDVAAERRAAMIGGRAAPMLLDPQHSFTHLQKHLQQVD
jgi:hypothetical protein